MGTRLQKLLGYGLSLTSKEYQEQINAPIEKFNKTHGREVGKPYADFVYNKYKDNHKGKIVPTSFYLVGSEKLREKTTAKRVESYKCFVQIESATVYSQDNPEMQETPDVVFLLVPPFEAKSWNRNDDDIDYVQHFVSHNEPVNKVTELTFSPYPYDGTVMNLETGHLYGSRDYRMMINFYKENLKEGTLTEERKEGYDKFFQTNFNMSAQKALNTLTTSSVPTDIQDLAELIGLTEPGVNFTHKLKPMLAEHWS